MTKRSVVLLLLALALAWSPALAADRFELLASSAQTANGNTPAFTLTSRETCAVGVNVTAGSGTVVMDVRMEGSPDNGTTWYSMGADWTANATDTATAGTQVLLGAAGAIDIIDNKTTTTAVRQVAYYRQVAFDKVRLRWFISGTTPSLTFEADMVCK